ncbi:hypothetical protein BCI9360_03738 [Bacillus sp. CECT 9360]|nr:hypothetical protein BCI9360_03738 [Bacillus sp. CECT 9360]
MKRGILVFDHYQQEWRAWLGQQSFWVEQGHSFELRIQTRYLKANLQKDFDWFITLESEVRFVLHTHEVYKIRIKRQDYITVHAPF